MDKLSVMDNIVLMNKKLFLQELIKRRAAKKWSQKKVGEMIDVGQNTYSRIENGQSDITIDKVEKLCEIFEIDLSTLDKEVTKGLLPKSNSEISLLTSRVDFLEKWIRQSASNSDDKDLVQSINNLDPFDKDIVSALISQISNLETVDKLFIKAIALKDHDSVMKWGAIVTGLGLKIGKILDEYYVLPAAKRDEFVKKNQLSSKKKSD